MSVASSHGLFLGRGFPWEQRHTQMIETYLSQEGALPIAHDVPGGHPALHAVGVEEEENIYLPFSEMVAQSLLVGATRSGKTELLRILATGAILGPGSTLLLDPQGSRKLIASAALAAHRAGKRFMLITPAFHAQSARLNVLATAQQPTEIRARIHALMPSAGGRTNDPFFEEFALGYIHLQATAMDALGLRPWTLQGLARVALDDYGSQKLLHDYLLKKGFVGTNPRASATDIFGMGGRVRKEMQGKGKPHGVIDAYREYQRTHPNDYDPIANGLIRHFTRDTDHFQKITSSLDPCFSGLVGEPYGPLLSVPTQDSLWQQIEEEPTVIYVALASLMLGDTANRIGRIMLQDLIGYLGRRYAYHDPATFADMPLTIVIDELADVLYPGFTNAVNKGGGAEARFILAMQSIADPASKVGREEAQRLLDNLTTKCFFRLGSDPTAEAVSEGLGTARIVLPDDRIGIGYGGEGGLTGNASRSLQAERRTLIDATWLKALPRGQAFVWLQGQLLKLRVPLLEPVTRDQLQMLGLLDIWEGLRTAETQALACTQPPHETKEMQVWEGEWS